MTDRFRTPSGGRIDRGQALEFSFDGQQMHGCQGDTLASALLANGVHLVGRSFKYHRPRGILSAGSEEPNALVTVDRGAGRVTPNQRATQVELYSGLQAHSQNRWPSLTFDVGAISNLVSPLLVAGFYYKTFKWPAGWWRHLYEPAIRAAAGLGRPPVAADPDRYLQRYAHCDVLVVGAGPAGLAAALAAAATGARVILCDEQAEFGGSLLAEPTATIDGASAADWVAAAVATLRGKDAVTLLPRTTAFGWYPDNLLGLAERVTDHLAEPNPLLPRERLWQVRARQVVIAAGAIERPLVFPGNDRPGIMLAGAARSYLHRYGVKVGERAVLVTTDPAVQFDLPVVATVDPRAITGTTGRHRVQSVRLSTGETIACDAVLMAGGWTPSVHLFSQSRGKLKFDDRLQAFLPGNSPANVRSVGACVGTFDLASCLAEGDATGRSFAVSGTATPGGGVVGAATARRGKAFVDLQNDVTLQDLKLATREGFRSIEHVKRYTTAGMATDQGKTANLNALAIVADTLQVPIPAVGHTTFRPPYTPVTFGALAGAARDALFDPIRRTPLHDWAAARGALFENVGAWQRARCFPLAGEDMHAAVARECRAVRQAVGIFDGSTLGKIEVVGPDAAEFLNRIYPNDMLRLAPGRCRYGVMLNEAGYVFDDGVVGRLAPDRFHVTTTTGGAAAVLQHMEDYRQTEWPELRFWLTSVTEQWAVIAVQGPLARQLVAPLVEDIDLAAMPHMSVREGHIQGVPTRLFRVSFTGEAGFEINVPAEHASTVWDAVYQTGGVTPYGTEAMHVLRAEKGYIITGQETDGTVTPLDLGLGRMMSKTKRDFVGKRSLARPDFLRADRKQLVGLLTGDPQEVLEEGVQLVAEAGHGGMMRSLGYVTSSYWSATLGRSIAMALLEGGRDRIGAEFFAPLADRTVPVVVTEPVFFDPAGARLNG